MVLNGVVIADPAKLNRRKILNDHYTIEMKQPGKPQGAFVSEQSKFHRFDRSYSASDGIRTIVEVTVPVTTNVRQQLESDVKFERHTNLHADVEKPILETDKNIHDTMKAGSWFDLKTVNQPEFKETVRPFFRVKRDPVSKLTNPYDMARQFHYVYNFLNPICGNKGYQSKYYANNYHKDSKGRIHLFDTPFTRLFA